jgi:oxygen-independent coproporphyrinogen-3 oxidase
LTGLAIRQPDAPSTPEMAGMYDDALDRLARAGYRQLTMRQFRRDADADADEYCCMHDGMVGLGAGARSYTKGLHYSTPWKMVTRNIRTVVDDYVARMRGNDTCASYGIELDENEQQRRFIILCLLHEGLVPETFTARFGGDPQERFSEIWGALFEEDCVRKDHDRLCLTARGTRHADIVGQMFFSERVRTRMASYEYDS